MAKTMISIKNITKTFKLPSEKKDSLKGSFLNPFKRRTFEKQQVLQSTSIEVKSGEFFGIVGRNGSGKSTLLKLLAGIYTPDSGEITINGRLTPFIELGVGFNPDLTGKENVYLNGALLGFDRKEIHEMYDDIVSFSELERFMGQKLKNYSSGMQVRLAFSIAIRAKSEILLIDEVLAVGDAAFQRKCYETFSRLKTEGRTIVFITHDMSAIERFCDRAAVIDRGEMKGIFTPSEAASIYQQLNAEYEKTDDPDAEVDTTRWGSGEVKVASVVYVVSGKKVKKPVFTSGDKFKLELSIDNKQKKEIVVGIGIEDTFGVNIAGPNSMQSKMTIKDKVTYTIDKLPLLEGDYNMTIVLFDKNLSKEFDHLEKYYKFRVVPKKGETEHGKVDLFGKWDSK
jgi:ABC-2 type transport system ATP-binding protein